MNGHVVELRVHVVAALARCLNSARGAAVCRSVRDADVQVSLMLQVCQSNCMLCRRWRGCLAAPRPPLTHNSPFRTRFQFCLSLRVSAIGRVCCRSRLMMISDDVTALGDLHSLYAGILGSDDHALRHINLAQACATAPERPAAALCAWRLRAV